MSFAAPQYVDPSWWPHYYVDTFGGPLIGSWVVTALWGMATMQTFGYYGEYPGDTIYTKAVVAVVWILSCLHALFSVITGYHYLIATATNINSFTWGYWGIDAAVAAHTFIAVFVYAYFMAFAYRLSKNVASKVCVLLFMGGALVAYTVTGFYIVGNSHLNRLLSDQLFEFDHYVWWLVLSICAAFIGFFQMIIFGLLMRGAAFKRTTWTPTSLVRFAVSRGIPTTAMAITAVVSITKNSDDARWAAFLSVIAGLHVNSLFAALRSRTPGVTDSALGRTGDFEKHSRDSASLNQV